MKKTKPKRFTNEFKAKVINEYLEGKGTPIDDSPMESWHGILKKETLYNNQIKSLDEYIQLVEDWIIFYNTKRLKNRKPKPPIN